MQFLEKLLRKHRYVKLAAAETKTIYLASELNYQIRTSQNIYQQQKRKKGILVNRPTYLGLSILELSKILIYEFRYYYVQPKYSNIYIYSKYSNILVNIVNIVNIVNKYSNIYIYILLYIYIYYYIYIYIYIYCVIWLYNGYIALLRP